MTSCSSVLEGSALILVKTCRSLGLSDHKPSLSKQAPDRLVFILWGLSFFASTCVSTSRFLSSKVYKFSFAHFFPSTRHPALSGLFTLSSRSKHSRLRALQRLRIQIVPIADPRPRRLECTTSICGTTPCCRIQVSGVLFDFICDNGFA